MVFCIGAVGRGRWTCVGREVEGRSQEELGDTVVVGERTVGRQEHNDMDTYGGSMMP